MISVFLQMIKYQFNDRYKKIFVLPIYFSFYKSYKIELFLYKNTNQ